MSAFLSRLEISPENISAVTFAWKLLCVPAMNHQWIYLGTRRCSLCLCVCVCVWKQNIIWESMLQFLLTWNVANLYLHQFLFLYESARDPHWLLKAATAQIRQHCEKQMTTLQISSVLVFVPLKCFLFMKRKTIYQKLPGHMWRSHYPLNPVTGGSILVRNSSVITGNESFSSLWRNFGPLSFAELF